MTQVGQEQNECERNFSSSIAQVLDLKCLTTQAPIYSRRMGKGGEANGREMWDGGRLRELREARGLTQGQLAERSGSGEAEISRHERNHEKSNPGVDVLGRYAVALDVPLYSLFESVGSSIPRPEEDSGHGERARQHSEVLERLVVELDAEAPAPDTWRGDVLKAIAALNRALRRGEDSAAPGDAASSTRR